MIDVARLPVGPEEQLQCTDRRLAQRQRRRECCDTGQAPDALDGDRLSAGERPFGSSAGGLERAARRNRADEGDELEALLGVPAPEEAGKRACRVGRKARDLVGGTGGVSPGG